MARRKSFHHGALRPALIKSALEIIAKKGTVGLNLRAIGKRAGVTHAAVYWHFADKDALLAAVAAEGFRALFQALDGAVDRGAEVEEQVRQVGRTYVGFALAHPVRYRLMHGPELADRKAYPELDEARGAVYLFVRALVATAQERSQVRPMSPDTLVLALWGMAHGVALLLADFQLTDLAVGENQALVDDLTAALVDGIRLR